LGDPRCRQFDEGQCSYGPYCNFLHVKKVRRSLQKDIEKRYKKKEKKERSRSRSRSPRRRSRSVKLLIGVDCHRLARSAGVEWYMHVTILTKVWRFEWANGR
jgi:hypothetical protein